MIDMSNKEEIRNYIQLAKDSGTYKVGTVHASQPTPKSHWRKSQFGKKNHSLARKERHVANIHGMVDSKNGNGFGINNKIDPLKGRVNKGTILNQMKAMSNGWDCSYSTDFSSIDNQLHEEMDRLMK